MNKLKLKKQIKNGLFFLMVAMLVIIFISPFMVVFLTSFKTNSDAFTTPVELLSRRWITDNFPATFAAVPYFGCMGNTIFVIVLSVTGQVLVAPLMTYFLSKVEWKGADIISGLIVATIMIPITVTMMPLYKICSKLGLTSIYIPPILPAFFGKTFYIMLMRQFFGGVPDSLIEAARIDGASHFTCYWRIAAPLYRPALTAIGIYAFLDAWSDYLYPLILIAKSRHYMLSLGLRQYLSEYSIGWSRLVVAVLVSVLPVIVCFAVFQRNFVEGIATNEPRA